MESWERVLESNFPGYLLPESLRSSLPPDAADRFLRQLTGRSGQLDLLLSLSFSLAHLDAIASFAIKELPALIKILPSTTFVQRRVWEGGFSGRLDVRHTLAFHFANRPTTFVTRNRRREFSLPENILLRAVALRLAAVCRVLIRAKLVSHTEWGRTIEDVSGRLEHIMSATILREVPDEPIEARHIRAARMARHAAYHSAARLHDLIRTDLDTEDPERIASVVSRGALRPLEPSTRFEIAVLIQLIRALEERLVPRGWTLERGLVIAGRKDVATFRTESGRVRLFYNQSILPSGTRDRSVAHYLGSDGRLRPDITIISSNARGESACVVEIKLSEDVGYLSKGLEEALLYRHEYKEHLSGWPKAILVTSADIAGAAREDDEVIAVDFRRWPPDSVLEKVVG